MPPMPAPTMAMESLVMLVDCTWIQRYKIARSRGGTGFALNLCAVHYPARAGVKRIAAVHGAAVVPQDQVADAPFVMPFELFAIRVGPQFIEQGFRFRKRQSLDVSVA